MLSRLADSLYWAGRYVERTEHLSRYLRVQYFTTMDAPMADQKDFILRSILNMAGIPFGDTVDEEGVLVDVPLNGGNTRSMLFCVTQAKDNALACRSVIWKELWEAINRLYHFVKSYPVDEYKTTHLYHFTTNVQQQTAYIYALLDNTLLHDDTWNFIKLGQLTALDLVQIPNFVKSFGVPRVADAKTDEIIAEDKIAVKEHVTV